MILKSYAGETHQGPLLNINEDHLEIDLQSSLYFILDGFGGSGIGDVSSKFIADTVKEIFLHIGGDPDSTLPFFFSPKFLIEGNALINALHYSHKKLLEQNYKKVINQRGGASGIFAALSEQILTLVGIGNCRAYHMRKGFLERVINDDSLRLLSQDDGTLWHKTSPANGLGLFEHLYYSTCEVKVAEDDLIILLTDGIYSRLTDQEIHFYLSNYEKKLSERINDMFKNANEKGNQDNQTALILQF